MIYVFDVDNDERLCIYDALCTAGYFSKPVLSQLANPRTTKVQINEGELGEILKAFDQLIYKYDVELSDWGRAEEFKLTRKMMARKIKMYPKTMPTEYQ